MDFKLNLSDLVVLEEKLKKDILEIEEVLDEIRKTRTARANKELVKIYTRRLLEKKTIVRFINEELIQY